MSKPNTPPVLRIEGLTFSYPKKKDPIIKGASLTVWSGDRVGIIGSNGSGKSTLSKLLLGIYKPDGGQIELFGHPVKWRQHYPDLGYIGDPGHNAQELGLPTSLTVGQFSNTLCGLYGLNAASGDQLELLQQLGLSSLKSSKIANLSTGERKRLMAYATFLKIPRFLILDEPFDGLDKNVIEYIQAKLRDALEDQELSLFLISHSKIEIDKFSTRVYRLYEGELKFEPQHYFKGHISENKGITSFTENTGQVMDRLLKLLEAEAYNRDISLHLKSQTAPE